LDKQNNPWFGLMTLTLAFFTLLMGAKPGLAGAAGPICRGSDLENQVALTFDDGPHPSFTPQILSLLNKYEAQATFFVLGEHAAQYPGIIRELVNSGQEVENHSFTHLRFPSQNDEAWLQEIERTEVELDLLGCPDHRLFRAPFSDYNPGLLQLLANIHQRLVLWSVDAADWREPDSLAITVNVLSQVRPGAIVIMHDSDETGTADRTPTVEALDLILPALSARGYQCVTVSELLASPPEAEQARADTGP
jgi:peptidoglycan/xylan/chitin deacetylase (PgdA/CDA1 family)